MGLSRICFKINDIAPAAIFTHSGPLVYLAVGDGSLQAPDSAGERGLRGQLSSGV